MTPKELVDAGVCVSMAQGRRLSRDMERSSTCRERVLSRLALSKVDTQLAKRGKRLRLRLR